MRRLSLLPLIAILGCAWAPLVDDGTPLARPTEPGFHHVAQGTHLLVLGAVGVLTDPRAYQALPTDPELVLITSERAYFPKTLEELDRRATLVVPAPRLAAAARLGFAGVIGVRAGERLSAHGLDVEVLAAGDDLAYLVRREGRAVFIGGDARAAPETGARAAALCVMPAAVDADRGLTPEAARSLGVALGCARVLLTHRAPGAGYPDWFEPARPGTFIPFPWDEAQPPSGPASTAAFGSSSQ